MPSIPGIAGKPLLSQDLLERLNFQRLEDAIREVPAAGGTSDLTGSKSPIPGIAYGALFRPQSAKLSTVLEYDPEPDEEPLEVK